MNIHTWLWKVAEELDALEGGRAITQENLCIYVNLYVFIYMYIHGFARCVRSLSRWKAAQQSLGKMCMYMSTYIYIYIYIHIYIHGFARWLESWSRRKAAQQLLRKMYMYMSTYIYLYTYTYIVFQGGCGAGRARRRHSNHSG